MAKTFIPRICGNNKIYIPTIGCTECDKLEMRVEALESVMSKRITFSHYNRDGESITAEVLGEVVE